MIAEPILADYGPNIGMYNKNVTADLTFFERNLWA